MKIGIEASAFFRKQKTGIGYYTHCLLAETIRQMPSSRFDLCYISFLTRRPEQFQTEAHNVRLRRIWFFSSKIYNRLDRYFVPPPIDLFARSRNDVFIFPNFVSWPLWLCGNSILFVHDLAFIDTPEKLAPNHLSYLRKKVPNGIKKANQIVTISESTKQQIMKHFGINEAKISVITPAVDHSLYVPVGADEIGRVKTKFKIIGNYLLYLGTLEPRKNIAGIIRAYQLLPAEIKAEYKLVLAGGKGWLDSEINQLANVLGDRLVRTGYVNDSDKAALYSGAKIFLYPSYYEGWGMQVLEAMACGTPVITANNSSLPEAGGEAAIYIETGNDTQLASAIESTLKSPEKLDALRSAGLKHSAGFTWEKSARKLVTVLQKFQKGGF